MAFTAYATAAGVDSPLEEVVVSATKRGDANVQDVPLSIVSCPACRCWSRARATGATSSAVFFFVVNLIGLGLHPLGVGLLSDALTPEYGSSGLRFAQVAASSMGLVAALLFGAAIVRARRAAWQSVAGCVRAAGIQAARLRVYHRTSPGGCRPVSRSLCGPGRRGAKNSSNCLLGNTP